MTNKKLQDMVDGLGADTLTDNTVYVVANTYMDSFVPSVQQARMRDRIALVGAENVSDSLILPLREALAKRQAGKRGRHGPHLVMEPVTFTSIVRDEKARICEFGKDKWNYLSQQWEKEPRIDQVAFRRPDDSHYSVLVTIEGKYTGAQSFVRTYHVTYLAASQSAGKERRSKVIDGSFSRYTFSYKSVNAALNAVYAAPVVSPHVVARTIMWRNADLPTTLNSYFNNEVQVARSAANLDLTAGKIRPAVLDALLSLMPGKTPVAALSPELLEVLQKYTAQVEEIMAQQEGSLISDYVVMVATLGDLPDGFVFSMGKDMRFKMRRVESLDCLPSAVVGRLQTIYVNKPALATRPLLAGVGALVKHGAKGLVREGTDCIAVLVTEEELHDIFKDDL